MHKLFYAFFIVGSVLAFGGCKGNKAALGGGGNKAGGEVAPVDNPRLTSLFIDASLAQALGDLEQAERAYGKVLELDNKHAAANYHLAQVKVMQEQPEAALPYAEKAVKSAPGEVWYLSLLAELYLGLQNPKAAVAALEKARAEGMESAELMDVLLRAYTELNAYEKVLSLLNSLEKQMGPAPEMYLQRKDIYLLLNKPDSALAVLRRMPEVFPGLLEARYETHQLLLRLNRNEEAVKELEEILEAAPGDPYAVTRLISHYEANNELDNAARFERDLFDSPDVPLESKIKYLGVKMQRARTEEDRVGISRLTRQLHEAYPEQPLLLALMAEMYENREQPDSARMYYQLSLEEDPLNLQVWQALLNLDANANQPDSLAKNAEKALEIFPNNLNFNYLSGVAYVQLEQPEKAKRPLEKFLKLGADDYTLLSQVHTLLGDVYHQLEDFAASEAQLEKALTLSPGNLVASNNLAYYIALREDGDLEKALALIEKVIDRAPENASYQDTYGYILYRLGRYSEARKWIEKAYEQAPDAEVAEHLGDLYLKLNKPDEARKYWEIALEKDPENAELRKKLGR